MIDRHVSKNGYELRSRRFASRQEHRKAKTSLLDATNSVARADRSSRSSLLHSRFPYESATKCVLAECVAHHSSSSMRQLGLLNPSRSAQLCMGHGFIPIRRPWHQSQTPSPHIRWWCMVQFDQRVHTMICGVGIIKLCSQENVLLGRVCASVGAPARIEITLSTLVRQGAQNASPAHHLRRRPPSPRLRALNDSQSSTVLFRRIRVRVRLAAAIARPKLSRSHDGHSWECPCAMEHPRHQSTKDALE